MKLRNFANKFLLIALLAVLGCAQGVVHFAPMPLAVAAAEANTPLAKTTYYFDQYNVNAPTGESLYDALGIKVYNDYLTALNEDEDVKNDLKNVVIAVVDSGLNMSHPVFNGRVLSEYAMDFSQGLTNQMNQTWNEDLNGHGTHVAGVLADMTLNNVQILPIRIFHGLDNRVDEYSLENAVRYLWALKTGNSVHLVGKNGKETTANYNESKVKLENIVAVNLSLGTSGYDRSKEEELYKYRCEKNGYRKNGVLYTGYQYAINRLLKVGILPIVAAGNVNLDEDERVSYYSLPSACEGVLSVAAYDNTDGRDGLYWSANFSYHNNYVSVSAPGAEIWSACSGDIVALLGKAKKEPYHDDKGTIYPDVYRYKYATTSTSSTWIIRQDADGNYYFRSDGTSMAAPFVTACYAMLYSDGSKNSAVDFGLSAWDKQADGYYMNPAHKALLAAAATGEHDQGDEGYDEYFGYGILSVAEFATDTVTPLATIKYELPVPTNASAVVLDNDDTDWIAVCVVLLVGAILIWGISLFKSYLNRRKTDDDGIESAY